MKTVGSLWMNSMAGWSAMASSRKKTTVAEQARDKAARAPNRSPNLQKTTKAPKHKFSARQRQRRSLIFALQRFCDVKFNLQAPAYKCL